MPDLTRNEVLGYMYENTADALMKIADHIERFKMNWTESVKLIREISEEQDAQSLVVRLRDGINK